MEELIDLLNQLREHAVEVVKDHDLEVSNFEIDNLVETAQGEIGRSRHESFTDGRIFRGGWLYGYESEEGRTQEVYDYLQRVLSYPEDHNIEVSLLYKREQKLNDLGI